MTILRSGSTKKYSDNWANAFGKKKSVGKAKKKAKPVAAKKAKKASKKKLKASRK